MNRLKFTSEAKIKCGQKWQNKAIWTQQAIIIGEPDPLCNFKDPQYEVDVIDIYEQKPYRMWLYESTLRDLCRLIPEKTPFL